MAEREEPRFNIQEVFSALIDLQAKKLGLPDIHSDSDFRDEIFTLKDVRENLQRLHAEGYPDGEDPGWHGLAQLYRPIRGQWTAISGIPRMGKSEFLDALLINLIQKSGWKIAMFSPENHPIEYHAKKMIEKFSGFPMTKGPNVSLSAHDLELCISKLSQSLFLLNPTENHLSVEALLDMALFLKRKHEIDGFVIDPWNELDHNRAPFMSETDYVSQALTKIRRFARSQNIHVWVVVHPTKMYRNKEDGKYPIPTPYDAAGSAAWANKSDFFITVWRDLDEQDTRTHIYVQKVRFRWFGKIGCAYLNWDKITGRYRDA